MREPISVEEKLALTLRYLVTGESCASLMYQYQALKPDLPVHEYI